MACPCCCEIPVRTKGKPTSARRTRRSGTFGGTLQGCLRFALATLLLAAACQPAESPKPAAPAACVDRYDPEVDYFPAKAVPRFAERFRVEYFHHYKVVTVTPPWDGTPLRYVLVQCGTPPPEGWDEGAIIEIPVRSVVTTSTTELPHLVGLGLVDRLVGHDELDYVNAPEIRRLIAAGELAEVGSGGRINVERVVAVAPDLVLAAGWGTAELGAYEKLRELGVRVVQIPSFLETSPLGRAEWVMYTALFFNREDRATELFDRVAARYCELAARARTAGERPTAFTGAPLGDVWHVPGGRSFVATLLADAGADYLWSEDPRTGGVPLAIESVYERALGADYWLQPGAWSSRAEIAASDERFARFAAYRARRVYVNDARRNGVGGNDYWETGTARPDLVLADLIKIFHPELVPEHELVFHRRLEDGS